MRARATLLMICLLFVCVFAAFGNTGRRRHTMNAVILVSDRFEMADITEVWVDENGGYLVSREEDALILRVPSEILEGFVDFLEITADEVIRIEQMTQDIGQEILEAEAGISSKTELYDRALVLLDETDLVTTLQIEREVLAILRDIEYLQGRHRRLLSESELALVTVAFTLEEETLPENLPSTFGWINRVDFYLMMAEFGQ